MGCVSSKEDHDVVEDPKFKEIAAKQRRKLSLAPDHVGDTTLGLPPAPQDDHNENKDEGKLDNSNKSNGDVTATNIANNGTNSQLSQTMIRVAHHSRKGFVPYNSNKVNQDRCLVKHGLLKDSGLALFGVMDGHGEFGHLVADYVAVHLPNLLMEQSIRKDPCASLTKAVAKLSDNLRNTGMNINFSGTTAVLGLQVDNTLYVANVGDSRCVLARKSPDGDYLEAVPLSTDHKPDLPSEKARILAAGGRVCPLPGPPDEDRGPDRVWLANMDVPGLAMSRSIGDEVSQHVGVISTPEITKYKITDNDLFAIWASDGVWEFISNEDAVATVAQYLPDLGNSTKALVNASCQAWKKYEEVIDDISVVIVQFNYIGE